MTNPTQAVNAWIMLTENEPPGTNYNSPNSCFQTLKTYGVYNAVSMLGIAFFQTNQNGDDMELLPMGGADAVTVLANLVRDSRAINPAVKLLATMNYGTSTVDNWFAALFTGTDTTVWTTRCQTFAANLVTYLTTNGLDGFDLDWEWPMSNNFTSQQFAILFGAIGAAFAAHNGKLYLTMAPATTNALDVPTVNQYFDFIALQLYYSTYLREEFLAAGISQSLLAYGAKFESIGNGDVNPQQDAQQAYAGYTEYNYGVAMQWRLNSGNFQYEQAQQMILAQLIFPPSGPAFDDSNIIAAAGNPPITQLVIRSGNVLDAITATNTGVYTPSSGPSVTLPPYALGQHGGNGGAASTLTISPADPITKITGYTGNWFGWNVVLQITLTTQSGKNLGTFGTMANATSQTPFSFEAGAGQSIVAFKGQTVVVPVASGGFTTVVASLGFTAAATQYT